MHNQNSYKDALAKSLMGITPEADRVANAILSGEIRVSAISSNLFDRYFGNEIACAVGNNIYVRYDSSTLLSDIVHEGWHTLDYATGAADSKSIREAELRARLVERKFQMASGSKVDFERLDQLRNFIRSYYPDAPFSLTFPKC